MQASEKGVSVPVPLVNCSHSQTIVLSCSHTLMLAYSHTLILSYAGLSCTCCRHVATHGPITRDHRFWAGLHRLPFEIEP